MTSALSEIAALAAEIERTRAAIDTHAEHVRSYLPGAETPAPPVLAYLSLESASWYNALEDCFLRVARAFGESIGARDRWHAELLRRMCLELPGVRPAVVPSTLQTALRDVMRFRHFVRHAYAVELDWAKMEAAVVALLDVQDAVAGSLAAFRDQLLTELRAE